MSRTSIARSLCSKHKTRCLECVCFPSVSALAYRSMGSTCVMFVDAGCVQDMGRAGGQFLKHLIGDIKVLMASCLLFHIACDLFMVYFCFLLYSRHGKRRIIFLNIVSPEK